MNLHEITGKLMFEILPYNQAIQGLSTIVNSKLFE